MKKVNITSGAGVAMITAGSIMLVHQYRGKYLLKPKVGLLSRVSITKLATMVFSNFVYY